MSIVIPRLNRVDPRLRVVVPVLLTRGIVNPSNRFGQATRISESRETFFSLYPSSPQPRKYEILQVYLNCMEPVIVSGADLKVDRQFGFDELKRGHIIVYRRNGERDDLTVKKVVAAAGERVRLFRGQPEVIDSNGRKIKLTDFSADRGSEFPSEEYIEEHGERYYEVPEGHVFVMSHMVGFKEMDQPVDSRFSPDGGRTYSPVPSSHYYGRVVSYTNYDIDIESVQDIRCLELGNLVAIGPGDRKGLRGVVISAGKKGASVKLTNGQIILTEPGSSDRRLWLEGIPLPGNIEDEAHVRDFNEVIVMFYSGRQLGRFGVFPFNQNTTLNWSEYGEQPFKAEFFQTKVIGNQPEMIILRSAIV